MAGIAEELSGGPVDASEIAVDGVPVVNDAGEWVGPSPRVAWTDILDIPPDFADGVDDDSDTDSFASLGLSCVDGDVPVWDGILGAWGCGEDTVLTADEVDAIVADNGYAMAADAFSRSFLDLLDVPGDLLDGDDDTHSPSPKSMPWSRTTATRSATSCSAGAMPTSATGPTSSPVALPISSRFRLDSAMGTMTPNSPRIRSMRWCRTMGT